MAQAKGYGDPQGYNTPLGTETYVFRSNGAFITGATLCVDGAAPMMPHHWPMPDHDRSHAYAGFHRSTLPESLAKLTKPDPET